MATRGTVDKREKEAQASANFLGQIRENMNFKDAFIFNDEAHQMKLISVIRKYAPNVVLCNAVKDRHTDHAKASELVSQSCFLSGLQKIKTLDDNGKNQEAFRPKHVFHYIQWEDLTPDFVINISGHLDKKMEAIRTFNSQFYNSKSKEPHTPISSLNFLESVESRAKNMGRIINKDAGEGFITDRLLHLKILMPYFKLIKKLNLFL